MPRIVQEAIKIILAVGVGYALIYPFLLPEPVGLAKELATLGIYGAIALGMGFFLLVVLYANDLRRVLAAVSADSRRAAPRSVWWMLVLPYNFIEDFFIIGAITASLRLERASNAVLAPLKTSGAITGFGWCIAQIASLIPNDIGSLFGLVAFVLWLVHWCFIRKALALLRSAATPT
ncbi:hypothetical protein ACTSKR_11615 [Chitinibacteraceae bacterium HSL-7]